MKYMLKGVCFVGLVVIGSMALATAESAKDLPKLKEGFSYEGPNGASFPDSMKRGGSLSVYVENGVVDGTWVQFQDYMREDYQPPKTSPTVTNMMLNGY